MLRSRECASAKMVLAGQAVANATLMRRTLTVTTAPIFKSFSRMVPAVAFASSPPSSPPPI
jgi:hypothetical protein